MGADCRWIGALCPASPEWPRYHRYQEEKQRSTHDHHIPKRRAGHVPAPAVFPGRPDLHHRAHYLLGAQIRWRKGAQPNLKLFIGGDREARYEQVIQVMDVVRQISISQVALETKWKEAPEKI